MKRPLISIGLILWFCSVSFAKLPEQSFFLRSTSPASAFTNFVVATGTIKVFDITVTSGVGGATFQFFNSTGFPVVRSTSPVFDTSITGTVFPLDVALSTGLMFTTTGNSSLRIRWDWLYNMPKGQDNKGY